MPSVAMDRSADRAPTALALVVDRLATIGAEDEPPMDQGVDVAMLDQLGRGIRLPGRAAVFLVVCIHWMSTLHCAPTRPTMDKRLSTNDIR